MKLIDLSARIIVEDDGVRVNLCSRLYSEVHRFKTLEAARSFVVQWTHYHLTEAPTSRTPTPNTAPQSSTRRTVSA